ncbi:D-aminoacyl-tRNA deacylase [Niallia nealsonii]|uniref:D-aminoacyl-tRNA deacylase n=1 Tax=Niallia nealsonii TaxID=115979 RepID=A0A2N0Z4I9_9BACI|nr:D-aminoacyl-tRNA deacylase [Niallia nealsonii]PKG24435.1 D-tyrosyl-tRNA(Tyr) deacylase [Niallia nealsonii]
MRIVLQRAKKAKVEVDGNIVGSIDKGFVLLVGITHEDSIEDAEYLADKIAHLRVFEDETGKMNTSILDVEGSILSVSQFTLYGDIRKGRRPNFMNAAKPAIAQKLYEDFNDCLKAKGLVVETGIFGSMMDVSLINDGPVTLILESK